MRPSCIAACAALGLWALGGCATYPPSTTINASDSGAAPYTLRISTPVEGPRRPGRSAEIEYTISSGKGHDQQDLVVGQDPIRFGSSPTTFNPPQTLSHDFEVTNYDAMWRARLPSRSDEFELEFVGGVGYLTTSLTVASATQRASDRLNALTLNGGVGGVWRFRPSTHLHARVLFAFPLGDYDEFQRLEVHLVQALGRYVSVRGGYAAWRIRSEPASSSGLKLDLSGPAIGLDVHF